MTDWCLVGNMGMDPEGPTGRFIPSFPTKHKSDEFHDFLHTEEDEDSAHLVQLVGRRWKDWNMASQKTRKTRPSREAGPSRTSNLLAMSNLEDP